MSIVKKILLVLIAPLFSLLLFALALDVGILRVVSHPDKVKHLISESGIYQTVIPGILDQQGKQTSNSGDVNLTDPVIKNAANKAFSPQVLQTDTEKIIDGVYHWLDGTTTTPDFRVDLSGPKATFADQVALAAKNRAASLPRCTTLPTSTDFDAFSANCLPRGATPDQVANDVRSSLLGGKGFLDNPVITADTVKNGDSSQPIFQDKLKEVPKQYQKIKKTPLLLAVLTVLVALAIIFLSPRKLIGVRRVGITTLTMGIFMLVFTWLVVGVIDNKLLPQIKIDNLSMQADVRNLVKDISNDVVSNYRLFGVAYAVLGALAIGGTIYIHHKQTQKVITTDEKPQAVEETETKTSSKKLPKN